MTAALSVRSTLAALVATLSCAVASTALAQAGYESVFDDYRSFREPSEPIDWRAANRTAAELGGFVGQMRATARGPADSPRSAQASPESIRGMPEMLAKHRANTSAQPPNAASPGPELPLQPAPASPDASMRRPGN